jgi:hypothetical protein
MDEAMEKIGQLGWKKMQKNIEQTRYNGFVLLHKGDMRTPTISYKKKTVSS